MILLHLTLTTTLLCKFSFLNLRSTAVHKECKTVMLISPTVRRDVLLTNACRNIAVEDSHPRMEFDAS